MRRVFLVLATAVSLAALTVSIPAAAAAGGTAPPLHRISWTLGGPGRPYATTQAVSCWSAEACVAVGSWFDNKKHDNGFSAQRSHHGWTEQSIASLKGASPAFSGVACPAAGRCVAVGTDDNGGGVFAGSYSHGEWTVTQLPLANASGRIDSVSAPSCPAAGSCVAAVSYNGQFVLERLAHGAWAAHPLPKPAANPVAHVAVSCPTVKWCAVTGTYDAKSGGGMFAATREHGAWTARAINPGVHAQEPTAALYGLSCPVAGTCVAVGQTAYNSSEYWRALVVRLSDGHWHGTVFPRGHAHNEGLFAVQCLGPRTCVAVGEHTNPRGTHEHALIETYSAGTWTPAVPANLAHSVNVDQNSVSCVAHESCRAVGIEVGDDSGIHPIATSFAVH